MDICYRTIKHKVNDRFVEELQNSSVRGIGKPRVTCNAELNSSERYSLEYNYREICSSPIFTYASLVALLLCLNKVTRVRGFGFWEMTDYK